MSDQEIVSICDKPSHMYMLLYNSHIPKLKKKEELMEKMNGILRKCKSLSISKLGKPSSYSNLRSKSVRDDYPFAEISPAGDACGRREDEVLVFVGSSKRPYVINAKHLTHPVLRTLLERTGGDDYIVVRCEVVLFDHLLWMLENVDFDVAGGEGSPEELANLYAY